MSRKMNPNQLLYMRMKSMTTSKKTSSEATINQKLHKIQSIAGKDTTENNTVSGTIMDMRQVAAYSKSITSGAGFLYIMGNWIYSSKWPLIEKNVEFKVTCMESRYAKEVYGFLNESTNVMVEVDYDEPKNVTMENVLNILLKSPFMPNEVTEMLKTNKKGNTEEMRSIIEENEKSKREEREKKANMVRKRKKKEKDLDQPVMTYQYEMAMACRRLNEMLLQGSERVNSDRLRRILSDNYLLLNVFNLTTRWLYLNPMKEVAELFGQDYRHVIMGNSNWEGILFVYELMVKAKQENNVWPKEVEPGKGIVSIVHVCLKTVFEEAYHIKTNTSLASVMKEVQSNDGLISMLHVPHPPTRKINFELPDLNIMKLTEYCLKNNLPNLDENVSMALSFYQNSIKDYCSKNSGHSMIPLPIVLDMMSKHSSISDTYRLERILHILKGEKMLALIGLPSLLANQEEERRESLILKRAEIRNLSNPDEFSCFIWRGESVFTMPCYTNCSVIAKCIRHIVQKNDLMEGISEYSKEIIRRELLDKFIQLLKNEHDQERKKKWIENERLKNFHLGSTANNRKRKRLEEGEGVSTSTTTTTTAPERSMALTDLEREYETYKESNPSEQFSLDEKQLSSLRNTMEYPVVCTHGGAGTGKTSVFIRWLIFLRMHICRIKKSEELDISHPTMDENEKKQLLKKIKLPESAILVAPTGKAARNLQENCFGLGDTIAMVVTYLSANENERKKADLIKVIIIEEASSVNEKELASLLSFFPNLCQLILVFDNNQIGPRGKGFPSRDILNWLQHTGKERWINHLTKNYRFGNEGDLYFNCDCVLKRNDKDLKVLHLKTWMNEEIKENGQNHIPLDVMHHEKFTKLPLTVDIDEYSERVLSDILVVPRARVNLLETGKHDSVTRTFQLYKLLNDHGITPQVLAYTNKQCREINMRIFTEILFPKYLLRKSDASSKEEHDQAMRCFYRRVFTKDCYVVFRKNYYGDTKKNQNLSKLTAPAFMKSSMLSEYNLPKMPGEQPIDEEQEEQNDFGMKMVSMEIPANQSWPVKNGEIWKIEHFILMDHKRTHVVMNILHNFGVEKQISLEIKKTQEIMNNLKRKIEKLKKNTTKKRCSGNTIESQIREYKAKEELLVKLVDLERNGYTLKLRYENKWIFLDDFKDEDSPIKEKVSLDYGFALTGNLTQGSQFEQPVIISLEDSPCSHMTLNHLYTMMSRAKYFSYIIISKKPGSKYRYGNLSQIILEKPRTYCHSGLYNILMHEMNRIS